MVRFLKACLFLVVSCFALQATAEEGEELLGHSNQGQIDYVDLQVRDIVINDWQYKLALDLKVHGKQGLETDFALQQGRRIKFEVNPATLERGVSTITDIWILQQ